jgi:hypothetical protein
MLNISGFRHPSVGEIITGDVYFLDVNATNTNDDPGNGKDPRKPFSTVDYALSKMTNNNDDALYVMAGHSETLSGAGGFTQDISGCKIIGLGIYDRRPAFLMDTLASGVLTAANYKLENMVFIAGVADMDPGFLITGKGAHLKNLSFEESTAALNYIDAIHVGAADNDSDGLVIEGCNFDMATDTAAVTAIDVLMTTRDMKIIDNRIQGDFDASPYAAIYSVNTKHHFNCEIARNHIHNAHTANGAIAISVGSTTSTGFMYDNLASGNEASSSTPFVSAAAGLQLANNLYSGDDSTSAYVLPAIGGN